MNTVNCPHCGQPIVDDGLSAGLVVKCPHCTGNMTMPAFEPPAYQPPVHIHVRQQRSSSAGGIASGMVIGFVLCAVVFVVFCAGIPIYFTLKSYLGDRPHPPEQRQEVKPTERDR